MYPIIAEFGPLTIYSFGVMMALGFYIGSAVSVAEYRRRGGDGEQMWNLLVWLFIGGLVGSKILSLGNDPAAFFRDPIGQTFSGSGFVWYGGLIGGLAVGFALRRRYNITLGTLLDCTALGLPVGQAIGRLGCHVAGDGDWGTITELPWGVAYTNAIIGWDYAPGTTVHPTPIYEFLAYMSVFGVLFSLRKRDLPAGAMFALYLVGNATARFAVEFIRINPRVAFGLTQAQLIAIVLFTLGAAWLLYLRSVSVTEEEAAS